MPFLLARERCDECLLTPERIVSAGRAKQIVRECERKDNHFICHKGSIEGLDLACRGFYDSFPGRGQLRRISERLGMVVEIDTTPEAIAAARSAYPRETFEHKHADEEDTDW